MDLKYKIRTYNFWISLSSAILLFVRVIGQHFGFEIDSTLFMDIVTALCGILVVLGIIIMPTNVTKTVVQKADLAKNNTKNTKNEGKNLQNENSQGPAANCSNAANQANLSGEQAGELQQESNQDLPQNTSENLAEKLPNSTQIADQLTAEQEGQTPTENVQDLVMPKENDPANDSTFPQEKVEEILGQIVGASAGDSGKTNDTSAVVANAIAALVKNPEILISVLRNITDGGNI